MKVLLINPQTAWKGENGFQVLTHRNFNDHLGIRYIGASLEKAGHEVDIIDAHFEEIEFDCILDRIRSTHYEVYGISFVEAIVEELFTIVDEIKKSNPDSKIFVGGYGATLIGDRVLENCHDIAAAVFGEGEISSVKLVNNINSKEKWSEINGIMFLDNDELIVTPANPLIENLDSIPWPKRAESYKYGRANMIASRGCYGTCTYCSISEFYSRFKGRKVRVRNPYEVVNEMEYVSKTYNVHYFDFVDDNFTCTCRNNHEWAIKFTNELKRRNLNLTWGIQARANDIDEELFSILYGGGLRIVSMGIENDVNRVIKLFKTGTSKAIHRDAIRILRKLGINIYIEMIFLEPSTTLEEIQENLAFLSEINFPEIFRQNPITFSTKLHLYTGTPVVEQMKSYAKVWHTQYHTYYEFADLRTGMLNEALFVWQRKTANLATLQLSYLQYEATNIGLYGIAMKIIKLSKRYLALDIRFYKELVEYIQKNITATKAEIEAFIDSYDEEVWQLESEFCWARDKVLQTEKL